jgi:hypothetical protein
MSFDSVWDIESTTTEIAIVLAGGIPPPRKYVQPENHPMIDWWKEKFPEAVFHLGGSRRMKQRFDETYKEGVNLFEGITEKTDWDYYADDTPAVREALTQAGYEETAYAKIVQDLRKNMRPPTDQDLDTLEYLATSADYAFDDEAITIMSKNDMQVVLRKNAQFYKRVFDNIDLDFYHDYLWKSSPLNPARENIQPFFNMLFKIAHATESK